MHSGEEEHRHALRNFHQSRMRSWLVQIVPQNRSPPPLSGHTRPGPSPTLRLREITLGHNPVMDLAEARRAFAEQKKVVFAE